jgi:hypothetical protein
MTIEEKDEALYIVETYRDISKDIEDVLVSLTELEEKKDMLMKNLESLKKREHDFMARYREKYGDRDLLSDLNSTMQ